MDSNSWLQYLELLSAVITILVGIGDFANIFTRNRPVKKFVVIILIILFTVFIQQMIMIFHAFFHIVIICMSILLALMYFMHTKGYAQLYLDSEEDEIYKIILGCLLVGAIFLSVHSITDWKCFGTYTNDMSQFLNGLKKYKISLSMYKYILHNFKCFSEILCEIFTTFIEFRLFNKIFHTQNEYHDCLTSADIGLSCLSVFVCSGLYIVVINYVAALF